MEDPLSKRFAELSSSDVSDSEITASPHETHSVKVNLEVTIIIVTFDNRDLKVQRKKRFARQSRLSIRPKSL